MACLKQASLAGRPEVHKNGLPGILQLSVSARSTWPVTGSAECTIGPTKIVIGFLAALGKLAVHGL